MLETGTGDIKVDPPQGAGFEPMTPRTEYGYSPDTAIVEPDTIGIPRGYDGNNYNVITGFRLAGERVGFMLVGVTSPDGRKTKRLYPASAEVGSDEMRVLSESYSFELPEPGQAMLLGREGVSEDASSLPANLKVNIGSIFRGMEGVELGRVSREHLLISEHADTSIRVTSLGACGTEDLRVQSKVKGMLIERQKPSGESSPRVMGSLAVKHAEKPSGEANDSEQISTEEDADALKARLKSLQAPFDEQTQHNIWRYASNIVNGEEMATKGNSQERHNHEREAHKAFEALPGDSKAAAAEYLDIMKKLHPPKKR